MMLVRCWIELEHNDGQQHQQAMLHIQIHKTSPPCCLGKCCSFRHWLQLFAAKEWTGAFYKHVSSPADHVNSQEGWPPVWTGRHSPLLTCTDAGITPCTRPQHALGTSEMHHPPSKWQGSKQHIVTMHCTWVSSETVHHFTNCITPKVWWSSDNSFTYIYHAAKPGCSLWIAASQRGILLLQSSLFLLQPLTLCHHLCPAVM